MTTLTIFMLLLLCVLWRVSPRLSPCTVFATVAASNYLPLYVIYYLQLWPSYLPSFWVLHRDYSGTIYSVGLIYLLLVVVALVAAVLGYLLHTSCQVAPVGERPVKTLPYAASMIAFLELYYASRVYHMSRRHLLGICPSHKLVACLIP